MSHSRRRGLSRFVGHTTAAWLLAGACGFAGCRSRAHSPEQYIPSEAVAREAVVSALEAWKTGQPPAKVADPSCTVQVADTHRTAGQTLARYDILGAAPLDGGRRFAVRLHLENPAAVEKAQYLVLGIDPLWVFRQEDYDMLAHWDHAMPPPTAPGAATPTATTPVDGSPETAPSATPAAAPLPPATTAPGSP